MPGHVEDRIIVPAGLLPPLLDAEANHGEASPCGEGPDALGFIQGSFRVREEK
jgi:hypothetical protein